MVLPLRDVFEINLLSTSPSPHLRPVCIKFIGTKKEEREEERREREEERRRGGEGGEGRNKIW